MKSMHRSNTVSTASPMTTQENHVQTPFLRMQMWWAKTSRKQMFHMETLTTPTVGVTLTFPGNLSLLYMDPQEYSISKHPPPLRYSKPFEFEQGGRKFFGGAKRHQCSVEQKNLKCRKLLEQENTWAGK